MKLMAMTSIITLAAAAAAPHAPRTAKPSVCRIAIENEGNVAKLKLKPNQYIYETQIAANPRNPNNLIASGLLHLDIAGDASAQDALAYWSMDGGKTWHRAKRKAPGFREGDAVVHFDATGTAYYLTLGDDKPGQGVLVAKSSDGGKSWSEMRSISPFIDHVMLGSDRHSAARSPKIFGLGAGMDLSVSNGTNLMQLISTADGGRNWRMEELTNVKKLGDGAEGEKYEVLGSVMTVAVSRDGRVYLPFVSNAVGAETGSWHWFMRSDDNGQTFTKPRRPVRADGSLLMHSGQVSSWGIGYALDTSMGPFSNRLYLSWMEQDPQSKQWQLRMSFSDDRGETWHAPLVVETADAGLGDSPVQTRMMTSSTLPTLSVNKDGVLVLTWYRFTKARQVDPKSWSYSYQRFVTASLDGGKSFLPARPLASVETHNLVVDKYGYAKNARLGDYLNMDSSPDGTVHALWMDGRSEGQHMWHSAIRISCNGKPAHSQLR